MSDRLPTTREVVADFLGVSPETVLRRWRAGELPGYRLASSGKYLRSRNWDAITEGCAVRELRRCPRDPDLALELLIPVRSMAELHLLGDPTFGDEVAAHFLANLWLSEDCDDLPLICGEVDECVHHTHRIAAVGRES